MTTVTYDPSAKSAHITLSGGNLIATSDGTADYLNVAATLTASSGVLQCEWAVPAVGVSAHRFGISQTTDSVADSVVIGSSATGYAWDVVAGQKYNNNVGASYNGGATISNGDVVGMVWDAGAGTITYYKNGTSQGVAFTGVTGTFRIHTTGHDSEATNTLNTGSTAFAHPVGGAVGWSNDGTATIGNGTATLQPLTGYGARVAAGAGTLQPIGGSGGRNGAGAGTMRAFQMSATGGHNGGAGTLSSFTASGTGRQANFGAASLAALTAAGTGYNSSINTFDMAVPVPTLSATIQSGEIITVSIQVPAPVLVATALNPAIITFSGIVRPPVLSAQILTGNDATFIGSVVAPILAAAGYPAATITFAGFVPAPYLSATMSAAIASAYRTFALNTRKLALSEYSNFSFNSYTVFNGVVLGCGPSGIVALGTQDADGSTAINSTVKSGKDNFGGSRIKRVPRIYIDYTTDGDAQFKLITTEGGSRTYALNWNSVTGVQQRRIPVGKGPKSVRWQWEYTNVAGADFDLNAVLAYPTATRRRVQ